MIPAYGSYSAYSSPAAPASYEKPGFEPAMETQKRLVYRKDLREI